MATVLVVDDRAINRELVRTVLGYGGHQVIEAHEGAEALGPGPRPASRPRPDRHPDARHGRLRAGPGAARRAGHRRDPHRVLHGQLPGGRDPAVRRGVRRGPGAAQVLRPAGADADRRRRAGRRAGPPPVPSTPRAVDHEYLRAVSAKLFDKAKALSDTEARFRLMADSSPVGIAFGDQHGSANYINARLTEIMGLPADDLLGLGWLRCAGDEAPRRDPRRRAGTRTRDVQHRYRSQIGSPDEQRRAGSTCTCRPSATTTANTPASSAPSTT